MSKLLSLFVVAVLFGGCAATSTEVQPAKTIQISPVSKNLGHYRVTSVNGTPETRNISYYILGGRLAVQLITATDTSAISYKSHTTNDSLVLSEPNDPSHLAGANYLPKDISTLTNGGLTLELRNGTDVIVLEKSLHAGIPTTADWLLTPWFITDIRYVSDPSVYWQDFDWHGKVLYRGVGAAQMSSQVFNTVVNEPEFFFDDDVLIPIAALGIAVDAILNAVPIKNFFDWDPPIIEWPYIGFSSTHMETSNLDYSTTNHYFGMGALATDGHGNTYMQFGDLGHNNALSNLWVTITVDEAPPYALHIKSLSGPGEEFYNLIIDAVPQ